MAEQFKEMYQKVLKNKKLLLIAALIGALILIFASSFGSTSDKKNKEETNTIDYAQYNDELENKLTKTVSSISGVGECKVMITLQSTNESVYAKNRDTKDDNSSKSDTEEYVIYDGDNGESPVLVNEYFPTVKGVAIVCAGGDNPAVREKVIETVSSLFNISTNRISVSKINNNG